MEAEFARITAQQGQETMDTARYELPPPGKDSKHSPEAWQTAVDNAKAQLEHQRTRFVSCLCCVWVREKC
jgi:pre-mRNA-splicing factor SPF27